MIKTEKVPEDRIDSVIAREEKDGWEFITAAQSTPHHTIGDPVYRSFSATYLLFFRKSS